MFISHLRDNQFTLPWGGWRSQKILISFKSEHNHYYSPPIFFPLYISLDPTSLHLLFIWSIHLLTKAMMTIGSEHILGTDTSHHQSGRFQKPSDMIKFPPFYSTGSHIPEWARVFLLQSWGRISVPLRPVNVAHLQTLKPCLFFLFPLEILLRLLRHSPH